MKENKPKPITKKRNCGTCDHCVYLGEGDHMCDLDNEIVINEWEPTDEYYHCEGRNYT